MNQEFFAIEKWKISFCATNEARDNDHQLLICLLSFMRNISNDEKRSFLIKIVNVVMMLSIIYERVSTFIVQQIWFHQKLHHAQQNQYFFQ